VQNNGTKLIFVDTASSNTSLGLSRISSDNAAGVQHAGMKGKVKLATFDADATQMQMMTAGTIQLAIAQEPAVEGADAVDQAVNALTGKTGAGEHRHPADRGHLAEHERPERQAVHLRRRLQLAHPPNP
jgi:ABC-type sugar transport system substrate-binding protein